MAHGSQRDTRAARREPVPAERPAQARPRIQAVLFDMDGVVTDTAVAHAAAWKRLFDEFLAGYAATHGTGLRPFDADRDYRRYVDGKPRYDGVRSFLEARGIDLPQGSPDDGPGADTVCGLGNRKNRYLHAWLARHEVMTFPGAMRLAAALRRAGVRTAVVSASRNAETILRSAGALAAFDVRVDGNDLARLDLPGKPDPALFHEAAARLGVAPHSAAVIEDAVAGIEAAARGGFAQVIGVDPRHDGTELRAAGADLVVRDLGELLFTSDEGLRMKTLSNLPLFEDRKDEIRARIAGNAIVAFLDYDGTLSPIVQDYTKAFMPDAMRAAVAELARHCIVAIVSGRDVDVLRQYVKLDTILYVGSHGFQIAGPKGSGENFEKGVEYLPALDAAEQQLRQRLAGMPGNPVERKRFSIDVHFRRAAEKDVPAIESAVDDALATHRRLRKGYGKKVFRIQPDIDWDKGHAVLWLLDRLRSSRPDLVPFYVGDDLTDEDAFRALAGKGISLVVRDHESRPTAADYALRGIDDVQRFLEFLAASSGTGTVK